MVASAGRARAVRACVRACACERTCGVVVPCANRVQVLGKLVTHLESHEELFVKLVPFLPQGYAKGAARSRVVLGINNKGSNSSPSNGGGNNSAINSTTTAANNKPSASNHTNTNGGGAVAAARAASTSVVGGGAAWRTPGAAGRPNERPDGQPLAPHERS
jgi:hypothetical protein